MRFTTQSLCVSIGSAMLFAAPLTAYREDGDGPFIGKLNSIKTVAPPVPFNGDVNPYGIAIAPLTKGKLVDGSILISNFNNASNLQGRDQREFVAGGLVPAAWDSRRRSWHCAPA
jgi:hypothetical protein